MLKDLNKNALAKIKRLMNELVDRDEVLEKQEDLLILEKEINLELKNLIALEKKKNEKLDLEPAKERRLSLASRAKMLLFKNKKIARRKQIKFLKCNLMLSSLAPLLPRAHLKQSKHP